MSLKVANPMMKKIIFLILLLLFLISIPSHAGDINCRVIEFYPYEKQIAFGSSGDVVIYTSRCATMIFKLSMAGSALKKGFSKEIRDKVIATFANGDLKTARSVRLKNTGNRIRSGTYTAKACFGRHNFPIINVECK